MGGWGSEAMYFRFRGMERKKEDKRLCQRGENVFGDEKAAQVVTACGK